MAQAEEITVGVLALQGAFHEHIVLLRKAAQLLDLKQSLTWTFIEVRTAPELVSCDALVIPGGESTTMALVAAASGLLEPLREFVKIKRYPCWGTCAGLIFLAEAANRTKSGGQDLIGGLDVQVNRNHFGRQTESFITDLDLPFLTNGNVQANPFEGIFIRAPIVEKVLLASPGKRIEEIQQAETVVASSKAVLNHHDHHEPVEIMARLPDRIARLSAEASRLPIDPEAGDIVAVKQGNVFGTSFHPELTQDPRIHLWWLQQVLNATQIRRTV